MKTIIAGCIVALAAAGAAGAQETRKSDGVAGTWELTVKGPAAHGDLTATMELQQEGKKVTGSFNAHGSTHTVEGEFSEGELSLETTDTPADHSMTLNGRLTDTGRLTGYLSSSMGDMQWTGVRAHGVK
jgi:hypothetical protein